MIRQPNLLQPMLAVLIAMLGGASQANAAANFLPVIGGGGGAQFRAFCGAYQNLTGFSLRAGDDIDAISPKCLEAYSTGVMEDRLFGTLVNGSPIKVEAPGTALGYTWKLPAGWHGGVGGSLTGISCPHERPVVVAMYVAAEGVNTVTVNNIHLYCGLAVPSQQLDENPSAIFDAPKASGSPAVLGIGGTSVSNTSAFQRCPEGKVAVGVHGRSGEWVDAIGLICDAPRITKAMALGRVESTTTPDPTKSICDYAKSARERNSPSAPGLERQCNAKLAANPPAPASAAAPVVAPAAPSPPVLKPHDLRIGRVTYSQDGKPVTRPVVGKPVAIACSYFINAAGGRSFSVSSLGRGKSKLVHKYPKPWCSKVIPKVGSMRHGRSGPRQPLARRRSLVCSIPASRTPRQIPPTIAGLNLSMSLPAMMRRHTRSD